MEEGVHHHGLLMEPVAQHLLGIIPVVLFHQAELTSYFNVLTAYSNVKENEGLRSSFKLLLS